MTTTINFTHNGFHGYTDIRIRPIRIENRKIPAEIYDERFDNETYQVAVVSLRTARRLNKMVCPSASCTCGNYVARTIDENGNYLLHGEVCLPEQGEEMRDSYASN